MPLTDSKSSNYHFVFCLVSLEASASLFSSLGLMIYFSSSTSRGFITTTRLRHAPSCRKDRSNEHHHSLCCAPYQELLFLVFWHSEAIEQRQSGKHFLRRIGSKIYRGRMQGSYLRYRLIDRIV